MAKDIVINYSSGEILEPKKNLTLGERFFSGGNPLPEDPTKPINPWAPKPIGPVLPNKQLAELTNMNTPDLEQSPDSFLKSGETLEDWDVTFRRPNADGGFQQQLVAPSVDGSRPGYAGRKLESGKKGLTINGKQYRKITQPGHPKFGKIVFPTSKDGKDITEYLTVEEVKNRVKGKKKMYQASLDEVAKKNIKISQKLNKDINSWASNWFKNNQLKYDVRDFDKFSKAFGEAWKKELAANPDKYKGYGHSAKTLKFTPEGLPAIKEGITIDGIQFPQRMEKLDQGLAWRKLFYKNKLKDKNFKSKINQYLDWTLANKKLNPQLLDPNNPIGEGARSKTLALEYGKKFRGFDDDVVYFMGEVLNNRALNPGGVQTGIHDIFRDSLGKKGEAYFKKYHGSWGRWTDNFFSVAKLAGLNETQAKALLQKQINDTQKIMKGFNVKKLPPEFMVAQDHIMGLAEAKALGDPKIAGQTLNNLIASTREQNRVLGQEGFSNRRVKLMKDFKAAPKNARGPIIEKLNTLSEEFVPGRLRYDVRKDGSLKITNLQPETSIKAKTKAYSEITKTFPKNIQKLLISKYKPDIQSRLNSGIPLDDIFQRIAADLNLPIEQIKNVAGKTLRGLGKFAVVADPMFAAMDASEAFGKGASGKDTAEYVTKRFFEGIANLPAVAIGGAGWLKDKAQGKDAKFDMPYEFTFAQDALQRDLDRTPENVKQRRIAEIEFDNTILPNMTMVDVMEESASKEDIETARDTFLKERLGENYKNTHPKEGEIDIEESEVVKDKYQQWLARGGRVGFSDGSKSPNEILEAIKKEAFELENNWNTEKNWWENLADVVDVRNVPYYADRAMRGVANVAEVSAKLPFVAGELISDLIQKPGFKRVPRETSDSDDEMSELFMQQTGQDYRLKPTDVWGKAWDNIMPGTFSEKLGLDSLISDEELRMQEQGMSQWPQIAGSNIELGVDVTLPWGYIGAARKAKQLEKVIGKYIVPGANIDKKVSDLLTDKGMGRRDFMKIAGSMGVIGALKALGLDKLLKGVTRNPIPGPIKMVERSTTKMPLWFPKFIDKVNEKMTYKGDGMWDFTGTDDFLPGFHIERVGDDYYISGKNEYDQDFQITYESPKWEGDADGSYYNHGEFIVEDSVPVGRNPEDVDFDGEVVEDIHDVLGGTKGMEEIAKGEKIDELTKGENAVIEAEVRAEQSYDMARDEGYFDDVE